MPVTFDNATFGTGQSSTGPFLLQTYTGTEQLSGSIPVSINGMIDQPGSTVQVTLNTANATEVGAVGTYLGFSDLGNGDYAYYCQVTGADLVTPVTIAVTGAAQLQPIGVAVPVNTSNVSAPVGPNTPCFVSGTHIRTVRGEIMVEDLAIGDEVVTVSGATQAIVWIGHRYTDCASHPHPHSVMPVRVRAGAVAPGMPVRDLVVSPGHKLFFDGILIDAEHLVNGSTIVRETVDEVTYWHVELATHDIMLAEGMPAESYLDCRNRSAFDNAPSVVDIHPEFAGEESDLLCAPVVREGARLHAVRSWLQARARHLGVRTTADCGLQLVADGLALTPVSVRDGRFEFEVPDGAESLRLVSRTGVPREMASDSVDARSLGLCVTGLMLNGAHMPVGDGRLGEGWHDAEEDGRYRWTDGNAALPPARWVAITAHGLPSYPIAAAPRAATVGAAVTKTAAPLKLVG